MTINTTQGTSVNTVLQRAVVLTLEAHYLGNDRKVKVEDLAGAYGGRTPDEKAIRATKHLVDPRELTSANRVIEQAKMYLRSRAIPTYRVFGERSYLLPLPLVTEADEMLRGFQVALGVEAQLIAERYATAQAKQAGRLGPLYKPAEYPAPHEVAAAYSLDWNYVSFAAPERLETVDRALFEAAQQKYDRRMGEAYAEVKLVLRETLQQLTADIVKKLTPGDDGKPRQFRNTILDGLADFLGSFDLRNISDDGELAVVVARLRSLTKGIDPEQLRDIETVRARVLAEAQAAASQLDELVVTGRRGISFGGLAAA